MKQFITIFLFLSTTLLYSQKPNKTIHDSIFEVGDIIQLPKIIYCLGRGCCGDYECGSVDSIKTTADFINKYSSLVFQIQNHTDLRGSVEGNLKLSQYRARTMFNNLKPLLNDTTQLTAIGFGESQPIISQNEIDKIKDKERIEELHAINRRTVLVVVAKM